MISSAEQAILDAVNLDTPWELIERFTTLKREDPADVKQAAVLIAERPPSMAFPSISTIPSCS